MQNSSQLSAFFCAHGNRPECDRHLDPANFGNRLPCGRADKLFSRGRLVMGFLARQGELEPLDKTPPL